ncbi:MAG: stage III sporulation protein AA [Clostridiales bacterium]|nr:stage III sporulation protein AA [Clostridiales bacterium]
MLENILPQRISDCINGIPYNSICELRLRVDEDTIINIQGENFYLNNNSFSKNKIDNIKISRAEIQGILSRISNNSLYTINDQLIEGYATIDGGIRVGVCGDVVVVNGEVKTIKNISSLNFRFPHFVKNCSLSIYPYIVNNGVIKNTLIISPPGAGKTTYLRDLIYQMSVRENLLNILVIDERNEICSIYNGHDYIKLSQVDVYSNCTKKFAFNNGIRSMKPDVIFTDEINLSKDIEDIENALSSGVKVISTIHASNIYDLKNKPLFRRVLESKMFDRFVVLSNSDGVGTVDGIYNENLKFIGV